MEKDLTKLNSFQDVENQNITPDEAFELAKYNWSRLKKIDSDIIPEKVSRLMRAQLGYSQKELKDVAGTETNEKAAELSEKYISKIYIKKAQNEYRKLLEEATPSPDIAIGNIRDNLNQAKATDYSALNLKEHNMAKTSGQIEQDLRDILTEFERDKPKNFRPPGQISSHQALIVVKSPSLGNEVD